MNVEDGEKLDFKDVLIKPKRSTLTSRGEVDLVREYKFLHSSQIYKGTPIIAANMDTVGTFHMAVSLARYKLSAAIHKHYSVNDLVNFFSNVDHSKNHWYSLGKSEDDRAKYNSVREGIRNIRGSDWLYDNFKNVCLDVANGYQESFVSFVKHFRENNDRSVIMAGNVVSSEMTETLLLAGADIVKIGIGSGSVCTTRIKAGVGMPQLSAIMECADAAHGLKGHICSDGGITCVGDFGKAFGAGADFVMCGGMFAGHDECGGEIEYETHLVTNWIPKTNGPPVTFRAEDQKFEKRNPTMKFYGMSSAEAMEKHNGGVAAHRTAEGKSIEVPYKGKVEGTILEMLGGLRSTGTYIGASSLKEFSKRTTFVKVKTQSNEVFGKN